MYKKGNGTKVITIAKDSSSPISSETSPTMVQSATKSNGHTIHPPATNGAVPSVNRKKQKRREKQQAAKLAAEQPTNTTLNGAQSPADLQSAHVQRQMQELEARFREHGLEEQHFEADGQFDPAEGEPYYSEEDGDGYSGSYDHGSPTNGYPMPSPNPAGKKGKKKKKAKGTQLGPSDHIHTNGHSHSNHVSLPLPPLASTNMPRGPGISKEKIWNTSSQEERERIKEFWLSLGEDERKSLVKVEKDAVLKKMKEQQKHSCSCTVCGRKRTAIEEELEVLYDAYYEELEQYANHQGDGGPPMMPPPRRFGAMSGLQPPNRLPPAFNTQQPSRGRIVEQLGDDEEDDEEGDEDYSEEEGDEDEYSEGEEEEEPEEIPRNSHASDFFNFGNSLTVQGGILTVADDLLKNDGKKFIEMMEQLAERRMAREEDAREPYMNPNFGHLQNGAMHSHPPHTHNHTHPPPAEDEEYDDEDEEEEEYDSQDEDYDEEEMDTMTEEQRMEEGRRMFQIFAARMFEQRVLTAYKEKVASERQRKLLEELADEELNSAQKKAKKAKDAQKKKEKLAQKKQALAEEKAKRDAEKAAEEAARRQVEEKKAEDQRVRAEEKRKRKEAEKKLQEEERLRKEAEKQRQMERERERQAEAERKLREAKDKERREKEEARQKEKEAKEAKDREAKERREKQEKEKREKEANLKAERELKERQRREELEAQKAAAQAAIAAATKRPPIPISAILQHSSSIGSNHVPNVPPVLPKAPTPIKLRVSSSQQGSNSSVPQTPQTINLSQNVSPVPSTPTHGSPGPIGPPNKNQSQFSHLHQPQATSPIHSALKGSQGMPIHLNPFGGMPPMGMGFQPPMMPPGFSGRMQHEPMFPHQAMGPFRPHPNNMPVHHPGNPGLGLHQMPYGRGFPPQHGPPGFVPLPNGVGGIGQMLNAHKDGPPTQSHSRQQSASFDKPFEGVANAQAQPIARPGPIGRPSSVVHGQRNGDGGKQDNDDLNNHLGSSALLDDSDEPFNSGSGVRRSSAAPGSLRQSFPPPFGIDSAVFGNPMPNYPSWGAPSNPFGTSSLPGANYMGGWGAPLNNPYNPMGVNAPIRPSQPRSVAVRLMMCRACKNLEGSTPDGFYEINLIREQLGHMNPPSEQPILEKEVLDICETEGNLVNGGGSFDVRRDDDGNCFIRFENDRNPLHRAIAGEIGSPIVGSGSISRPPGF